MRIKYIVPFPFDEAGIANRAAQLPASCARPESSTTSSPSRTLATTPTAPTSC